MIKYISASWCVPCQNFKAQFEEGELDGIVMIDADDEPGLIQELNVRSVPTFIKFDEEGNEIDRQTGTMSRTQFLSWKNG